MHLSKTKAFSKYISERVETSGEDYVGQICALNGKVKTLFDSKIN